MSSTKHKITSRETYSIVRIPLEIIVTYDHDTKTITNDLIPTNRYTTNFMRINDQSNCYLSNDNTTITVLPPYNVSTTWDEVIFRDFKIIINSICDKGYTDYIFKNEEDIEMCLFLKCQQLPNKNKIALQNNNDTYKSEYKMSLPVSFNNTDGLQCFINNSVNSYEHTNIINTFSDIANNQIPYNLNDDFTNDMYITNVMFDIEWISKK